MNRNLVGSTYERFCIKLPQSRMKGERHRLSPLSLQLLYIFVAGQLPLLKDNLKCTQNMVTQLDLGHKKLKMQISSLRYFVKIYIHCIVMQYFFPHHVHLFSFSKYANQFIEFVKIIQLKRQNMFDSILYILLCMVMQFIFHIMYICFPFCKTCKLCYL